MSSRLSRLAAGISLLLAVQIFGCGGTGPACLPGKDVGDWKIVEASLEAVTVPAISCGKVVGYDVSMPSGEHASTIWRIEKGVGGVIGEKVSFSVDIDSGGPAADSLRASIESAGRADIGNAEARPALRGRVEVLDRVSPTAGVVRVVQLSMPVSGAGKWRVDNFQF